MIASKPRSRELTQRESQILLLLAMYGYTMEEIAEKLDMRMNTARTHVQNMLTKLNLRSRTKMIVWAWRTGWVTKQLAVSPIDECADCGEDLYFNKVHDCPVTGTTVEVVPV